MKALLATKAIVGKPQARQWRFFRDAVEGLLSADYSPEFEGIPQVQAAQFKFEVEDKLRRFYLRPGSAPEFVFTLVHHSELGLYGVDDGEAYPRLAGYCVLLRDLSEEHVGEGRLLIARDDHRRPRAGRQRGAMRVRPRDRGLFPSLGIMGTRGN